MHERFPSTLVILIDIAAGGYEHDVTQLLTYQALLRFFISALCRGCFCTMECKYWCALRGDGEGPTPVFDIHFPDGKLDDRGELLPDAATAINMLSACASLCRAGHEKAKQRGHKFELLFEHPVARTKGSAHAIPGREVHSTMWDTKIFKELKRDTSMTHIVFAQCADIIGAPQQKMTRIEGTLGVISALRPDLQTAICPGVSDTHQHISLKGKTADGRYATQGSEAFNAKLCHILARGWGAALQGSNARHRTIIPSAPVPPPAESTPSFKHASFQSFAHQYDPESCLLSSRGIEWHASPVPLLQDSGSDANIIISKSAFIPGLMRPAVPDRIGVGKSGQCVEFQAMGPAILGVQTSLNSKQQLQALFIERAYLPVEGHSKTNIISTGRIFATQGIDVQPNQRRVIIGNYTIPIHLRFYSPYVFVLMPKLIPARVITPDTMQASSHMLGSPALSLKLAHLRLGHMNMADTAKTLGLPLTRTPPCNVCNLFKAKSPSAGTSTSQPEVIGALVHIDAFGPFKVAALVTGHKFIVAAVDGCEKVVDFESYHEPTGTFCADYIERLHRTYATMYRAELKAVRFDNASVFNCEQVNAKLASLKMRRENSSRYLHFQLLSERFWQPMQHDAACMLATSQRPKSLYIHACMHALDVRTRLMRDSDGGFTWTRLTGMKVHPDSFRIFGADMWGLLLPEQRKKLGHDKADPHSIQGVYVGNSRTSPEWFLITPHKLWLFGAGRIDERSLLQQAPTTDGKGMVELIEMARSVETTYTVDGRIVEPPPSTLPPPLPDAPTPPAPQPIEPISQTKARRTVNAIERFSPGSNSMAIAAPSSVPTAQPLARELVLVPAALWPRYPCHENAGAGWTAEVMGRTASGRLSVRFLTPSNGKQWAVQHLLPDSVVSMPSEDSADDAGLPSPSSIQVQANAHQVSLPPSRLFYDAINPVDATASFEVVDAADAQLAFDASCIDIDSQAMMLAAVHSAGSQPQHVPGYEWALYTVKGEPIWKMIPNTVKAARALTDAGGWQTAMDSHIDSMAYDPYAVVEKPADKSKIFRLKWVFKYKVKNDTLVPHARLVFAHSKASADAFTELTFSSVCRPLHWKLFMHCSLVEGASLLRGDVVNAHQQTRKGPDQAPTYTSAIPGRPIEPSQCIQWHIMLNGMPPAGAEFTSDLAAHQTMFRVAPHHHTMTRAVSEPHLYTYFPEPGNFKKYIKTLWIVDDALIAVRPPVTTDEGAALLDAWKAHMQTRYSMTWSTLNGYLNNEIVFHRATNTIVITMQARLINIMKEHAPELMDDKKSPPPPTPWHDDILKLTLTANDLNAEKKRECSRLGAQLIFIVSNVCFFAQHPVYFVMRYNSNPSMLGWRCLIHTAHYLYGNRHVGLTLGGNSGTTITATGLTTPCLITAGCDAGAAEAGPSTGGHSIEVGSKTIQVNSGQHHATTLGSTDSETYELSRCVANVIGARHFMIEFGFPQNQPSPVDCDNSAGVLKAASATSDKRGVYMKRRVVFVQEAQRLEEILVRHVPGIGNRSDIVTKVIKTKRHFESLRDLIMNVIKEQSPAIQIHFF